MCFISLLNHLYAQEDEYTDIETYWYFDTEIENNSETSSLSIQYYISDNEFSITIYSSSGEILQEVILEIISHDQKDKQIKTKVVSGDGTLPYYKVQEGDFMFWKYRVNEEQRAYFDYSTIEYPAEAQTGPFISVAELNIDLYEDMELYFD